MVLSFSVVDGLDLQLIAVTLELLILFGGAFHRQEAVYHKLERLENRKKYLEKGERTKRTHRLCNLGGTVESLAPEIKDLTRTEMTELMEHIFSLSEVQRAVRHMAITHTNQANREKELKADGTISSERHAD